MVDIVKRFNWTYVSTIASEGSYGKRKKEMTKTCVCSNSSMGNTFSRSIRNSEFIANLWYYTAAPTSCMYYVQHTLSTARPKLSAFRYIYIDIPFFSEGNTSSFFLLPYELSCIDHPKQVFFCLLFPSFVLFFSSFP